MNLGSIPITDNHCHSLLRDQPRTALEFRACFTESYFSEIPRNHVPHTIFYQWGLRELAKLYECEPDETVLIEKMNARDIFTRTQHINQAANITTWLVDYGYSTTQTYSHDELKRIANVRVEPILRLEPLIEHLIATVTTYDQLEDAYRAALQNLRTQGYISLKSILAYRVGLDLTTPTREHAAAEFPALKEQATREGKLRIASKPLLDYFIPLAVEICARQEFPIQFHTGLGDPDQDILTSNPALLRPLFAERYRAAPIILLHAGYPYTRELGYLAAVYPHVYADFGLAIPFVTTQARNILQELFGLAPASKILYSSDAFHIPELYYLGAVLARRALSDVLEQFADDNLITYETADRFAELVLFQNAQTLYRL